MSYEPYYNGGWRSGQTGGTPITPEALNHMEQGIQGSAPAGYGLGSPTLKNITSLSQIDASGFYRIASNEMPTNNPWWGYAAVNGSDYATFVAHSLNNDEVVFEKYQGTWRQRDPIFAPAGYKKLLWVNARPASSFSAQTISLDLSEYQQLEIHTLLNGVITYDGLGFSNLINIGTQYYYNMNGYYDMLERRPVRATSTGVEFGGSYRGETARDDRLIPYMIYGIKGVQ